LLSARRTGHENIRSRSARVPPGTALQDPDDRVPGQHTPFPHSARERILDRSHETSQSGNRTEQTTRARSVDDRQVKSGGNGIGTSPGRHRDKKQGGGAPTTNLSFLKLLIDAGTNVLDPAYLLTLDTEAGSSKRLHEVVDLLRSIQKLAVNGPASSIHVDQSLDIHQMAAQVAFLEKKIVKLREKLKRHARETATAGGESTHRESSTKQNMSGRSIDKLEAELKTLRTESLRLESERKKLATLAGDASLRTKQPVKPQLSDAKEAKADVRRRLSSLQAQMRQMAAEKAAADANVQDTRGLAETVEAKLRDVVVTRETERIKLEAEQELLCRRIRDQDVQIQHLEEIRQDSRELEEVQARIVEVEHRIEQVRKSRRQAKKSQDDSSQTEHHAGELAKHAQTNDGTSHPLSAALQQEDVFVRPASASVNHICLSQAEPQQFSSEEKDMAAAAVDTDLQRHLRQVQQNHEQHPSADVQHELDPVLDTGHQDDSQNNESLQKLVSEQQELQEELQQEVYQKRRMYADALERHQIELAADTENRLAEMRSVDSSAVARAEADLSELRKFLGEAALKEQADADTHLQKAEMQFACVREKLVESKQRHDAVVRRQCDLSGRCYIALQPRVYHQNKILHYLSHALGVPCRRLNVLEEVGVPPNTPWHELVEVKGNELELNDDMNMLVRPLPDSSGMRGPALDNHDATIEESQGKQQQASLLISQATTTSSFYSPGVDEDQQDSGESLQVDPSDRSRVDSPDASECNMIRLTMEVSASTGPGKDEVGISSSTVVEGLMNLIQSGNSLLEDVAIVGACSLRGRAAFPAEDNMWYTQEIEVVTRVVRKIAGRECVITAHRAVSPLVVRLIATECSSDDEFILCLDDDEICALLGQKSPLRHMHELGKELVDALIEKLTFLNCKAETPVLVAIATVVAPRTELNVSPLAATIDCVVQDTPSIMDQGAAQTLVEPNVNSTRVLLEDVFFLRSRFFVFLSTRISSHP